MWKRIISCLLLAAMLSLVVVLSGCEEPNEYKHRYERNTGPTPVRTGEVVE
jgi:hypothetical protein